MQDLYADLIGQRWYMYMYLQVVDPPLVATILAEQLQIDDPRGEGRGQGVKGGRTPWRNSQVTEGTFPV